MIERTLVHQCGACAGGHRSLAARLQRAPTEERSRGTAASHVRIKLEAERGPREFGYILQRWTLNQNATEKGGTSILKTTLAHDRLCPSIRPDFVGKIWGNQTAKPCPFMPIRPLSGDSRTLHNLLLQNRKVYFWQRTESVSQHNGGVRGGSIHVHILPCRRPDPNSVCNLMPRRLVCINV